MQVAFSEANRKRSLLIILGIIFGGIILINSAKKIILGIFFAHYEPPPITVATTKAVQRDWYPQIAAVGNFIAPSGVEINAQASGNVTHIYFTSGQQVKQGDALIDLDDSIEQATQRFNQAQLRLMQINYQRQADLLKVGAASPSAVDEAKAKYDQASAQVEQGNAEIAHKHVQAPFSGRVGIRKVSIGQYVMLGNTDIVTLQSVDPLYLEFHLPEQLYKRLHVHQAITVHLDAYPLIAFKGFISAINSKIDVDTHNVLIQAILPNCAMQDMQKLAKIKQNVICNTQQNEANHVSEFALVPGMFASIKIAERAIPHTIVLPATAISYSLFGNSVFVVKQVGVDKNHATILRVKRVFVTTGEQQGNVIVIKNGINAGDDIVSSGELKLQAGARVVINNEVVL